MKKKYLILIPWLMLGCATGLSTMPKDPSPEMLVPVQTTPIGRFALDHFAQNLNRGTNVVSEKIELTTPSQTSTSAPACMITLENCPTHPEARGTFADSSAASSTNKETCFHRAQDYAHWCRSKGASATYLSKGKAAETKHFMRAGSCQITISSCPKDPNRVGLIDENDDDALMNSGACMQKGRYYLDICQAEHLKALYSESGHVKLEMEEGSYCQITQLTCPKHPSFVGSFIDTKLVSNSRDCLARANDYRDWCGNQFSKAAFYALNFLVEDRIVGRICRITQNSCSQAEAPTGSFFIPSNNQNECFALAKTYHRDCANPNPSTADFFDEGQLRASSEIN